VPDAGPAVPDAGWAGPAPGTSPSAAEVAALNEILARTGRCQAPTAEVSGIAHEALTGGCSLAGRYLTPARRCL